HKPISWTSRRMDQPPTKTVTVYRNGDAFYPGRKVVVNPHQVTTFDNFLTNLTKKIEAPFGAVRRLYTPTQGHKVQHLEELKHGHAYVAAGYEAFKTLNYLGITNMKPQNRTIKQILPVAHSRIVASSRWKKVTDGVCTINVFTNGELLIPAARIRIPKHTLKSWEDVLSMVTEKVALRTGAVFRLCRLDGRPVSGPGELENHQHYVAVGAEKFKPLPYEQWVPHRDLCILVESSVFNAQSKRSETAGATEVQDDRQVQVDLPIDQVKHNPKHPMSCLAYVEEEHVDVEDVGDMNASQDDSDAESLQQSSYEGSQNT
uniref:Si:dkey-25g12.4 n=1 Tax=Nothobranchius furzeri TaxID=105023 RepID=A0A8C6LNR7_NOTFU